MVGNMLDLPSIHPEDFQSVYQKNKMSKMSRREAFAFRKVLSKGLVVKTIKDVENLLPKFKFYLCTLQEYLNKNPSASPKDMFEYYIKRFKKYVKGWIIPVLTHELSQGFLNSTLLKRQVSDILINSLIEEKLEDPHFEDFLQTRNLMKTKIREIFKHQIEPISHLLTEKFEDQYHEKVMKLIMKHDNITSCCFQGTGENCEGIKEEIKEVLQFNTERKELLKMCDIRDSANLKEREENFFKLLIDKSNHVRRDYTLIFDKAMEEIGLWENEL